MFPVSDRVMVVTGGGSGIGLSCCKEWRSNGGTAVIVDRVKSHTHCDDTLFIRADVTSEEDMERACQEVFDRYRRIDALCHCAGILEPPLDVRDMTVAQWDRVLRTNLTGGFITCKSVIPYLQRTGGGALVLCSSIRGMAGSACHPAYAASKAGLNSLALSLAMGLGCDNIRVVALCPGSVVGTGLLRQSRGSDLTREELARLISRIPLRRAATPQDIARIVCFVASPLATHLTGVVLPVDGGERLQ